MPEPITATHLRANIYRILDEVLTTGEPIEIVRKGKTLRLVSESPPKRRLEDLPKRGMMNCTFDELVATTFEYVPDDDLF